MEIASNRTCVAAILVLLVLIVVPNASVTGIQNVLDLKRISWTFALIASITLWAHSARVVDRFLLATRVTMASASLVWSTAMGTHPFATDITFHYLIYPRKLRANCFYLKLLVGVKRLRLLGCV